MTKGIEKAFGLPPLDEVMKKQGVAYDEDDDDDRRSDHEDGGGDLTLPVSMESLKTFETRLKNFEGTDHARKTDTIYEETLALARNLADLAFNVDDKSRRGLIEQTNVAYKAALDAANSKRDAQLKLIKILQDQERLELEQKKFKQESGQIDEVAPSVIVVEDRNELVRRMREEMERDRLIQEAQEAEDAREAQAAADALEALAAASQTPPEADESEIDDADEDDDQ